MQDHHQAGMAACKPSAHFLQIGATGDGRKSHRVHHCRFGCPVSTNGRLGTPATCLGRGTGACGQQGSHLQAAAELRGQAGGHACWLVTALTGPKHRTSTRFVCGPGKRVWAAGDALQCSPDEAALGGAEGTALLRPCNSPMPSMQGSLYQAGMSAFSCSNCFAIALQRRGRHTDEVGHPCRSRYRQPRPPCCPPTCGWSVPPVAVQLRNLASSNDRRTAD